MRESRKTLRAKVALAADYIARQEETMVVLRTEIARLNAALEEARADVATQAAHVRESYRSKTGEWL